MTSNQIVPIHSRNRLVGLSSPSWSLDDDKIRSVAPSVFAENPHDVRSELYGFVPTYAVLHGLRAQGFQVYSVQQAASGPDRRGHAKHMLRLRHAKTVEQWRGKDEIPEIVLLNSHDGSTSFRLASGVMRFICMNGLISMDRGGKDIRVDHRGEVIDDIIDAAFTVVENTHEIAHIIPAMKALPLRESEREVFATIARDTRWDEEEAPITPEQLLVPRRSNDTGTDLWTTYNVIQENIIRGGIGGQIRTERGSFRRTTTREVVGIDQNVNVNRALWNMASRVMEMKVAA